MSAYTLKKLEHPKPLVPVNVANNVMRCTSLPSRIILDIFRRIALGFSDERFYGLIQ